MSATQQATAVAKGDLAGITVLDLGGIGPAARCVRVLSDLGARWVQIDAQVMRKNPERGNEIKIREAAMGSYFANINGQRAIRMRRVN